MLKPSPRQSSLAVALALGCCRAGAVEHAPPSLVDFSLDQLSDIVVTSVSRQENRLADAPASIHAISAAGIRRAGASSLPEAMRLAPNVPELGYRGQHSTAPSYPEFGAPGVRQVIERAVELKLALRF